MEDKCNNQNYLLERDVCEKQDSTVPRNFLDSDVTETVAHLIDTESNGSDSATSNSRQFKSASQLSTNHDRDLFMLKEIVFGSLKYRIVTQNMNGPCPLIAAVNALILKGSLTLSSGESVTREALTHLVANALLQFRPKTMNSAMESNYDKNLDDVINLLPDLGSGLDVNVRFRNVTDFEFTPAMSLFDLLGLNIYHGWLVDPECSVIRNAVGNMTYNELVERVCDDNSCDRALLEEFLSASMSQLTYYGLFRLMDTMKDNELAVLFRNNHFHTMLKRKDELFLLVSDSGYLKVPNVVWETLNNVEGNSVFVNSEFSSIVEETPSLSDYLLARELQNEEQELALRERQNIVKNRTEVIGRPIDAPILLSNEIQNNAGRLHSSTLGQRDNVTTPKEKKCTIS